MNIFNKNIVDIRKVMNDLKGEKCAIVNPEIAELDEYTKSLYLKVLCTIIQYENDITDMQILFLKRIVNGMNVDDSLEECMKKALEISETDIQEFLSVIGDSHIKYYFVTEGLILSYMGNNSAAGYEFLAELIDLLGINKDDLKYVCMIVKSILQQQSSYYDHAKELVNERVCKLNFTPYIQNYYVGMIVDTDTEKYYYASDKNLSEQLEYPLNFKERRVVFENLRITLGEEWSFLGCDEVIFKKCELLSKGGRMKIESVGNLIFQGCKASGFSNRVAYIESVHNFTVEDCEFVECGYTSSGARQGGVFAIQNEWNWPIYTLRLIGNTVINCFIKNASGSRLGVTGVFVGRDFKGIGVFSAHDMIIRKVQVINNSFVGCRCIKNIGYQSAIIGDISKDVEIEIENNEFTGEVTRLFADR